MGRAESAEEAKNRQGGRKASPLHNAVGAGAKTVQRLRMDCAARIAFKNGEIGRFMRYLLPLFTILCGPEAAAPVPTTLPVQVQILDGIPWTVVRVDLRQHPMELVGQNPGDPHDFAGLGPVLLATNAGIFEDVDQPSGLFVEDGEIRHPLNRKDGWGNFYMSPNGVFWVDDAGAHVSATEDYAPGSGMVLATQSGPLLVNRGKLHPRLDPDSHSRHARNAVAVLDPWTVAVVYSGTPSTLYELAHFIKDGLGSNDALYLDGTISDLCLEGQDCHGGSWAGMLVVRG